MKTVHARFRQRPSVSDLESSAVLASLLFVHFQYELTAEKEDFRGLSALQIPHTVYGIRSAFICCPGSILLFPIWNFRIGTSELLPRTAKCTEFEEQISLENFAFVAISGHTVVSTFPRWLFTRHLRVCAGFQKVSTCQPCDQSKMYTGAYYCCCSTVLGRNRPPHPHFG